MATFTENIFESNAFQAGERATESAHRKIELQSPADLAYLIANLQRAAREKLDRHLPPDATPEGKDGEDAMRVRVEELVDTYIRNTFNAAKYNMCINGMDSRELDAELAKAQEGEEIEPFDSRLAQRIQFLSSQIEDHTLQLANLRRTAPADTAQRFRNSFTQDSERAEARLRQDEGRRVDMAKTMGTEMDVGKVERLDEIQRTWRTGAENLESLKAGLGGTVARLEKAQSAVDVVGEAS